MDAADCIHVGVRAKVNESTVILGAALDSYRSRKDDHVAASRRCARRRLQHRQQCGFSVAEQLTCDDSSRRTPIRLSDAWPVTVHTIAAPVSP